MTVFGHPIGMFLSEAAKIVTVAINLNSGVCGYIVPQNQNFYFSLGFYQIRFRTQVSEIFQTKY